MITGIAMLDRTVFLLLCVIAIPIVSIISSLAWRFGIGFMWMFAGVLTLLSPVMLLGGIVNIMTPGGYELGIGLLMAAVLAPITAGAGSDLQDEKYWIVLCQVVFGALALLTLPVLHAVVCCRGLLIIWQHGDDGRLQHLNSSMAKHRAGGHVNDRGVGTSILREKKTNHGGDFFWFAESSQMGFPTILSRFSVDQSSVMPVIIGPREWNSPEFAVAQACVRQTP